MKEIKRHPLTIKNCNCWNGLTDLVRGIITKAIELITNKVNAKKIFKLLHHPYLEIVAKKVDAVIPLLRKLLLLYLKRCGYLPSRLNTQDRIFSYI